MSNLLDGIINYLKMESTGALMISGEWGCGKTYHIDNVVIPGLVKVGYNPVKVSLFGIESVNDIPLRIAESYKGELSHPDGESEVETEKKIWKLWGKEFFSKGIVKAERALSSITWLSKYLDVKALVGKHSELLYGLIPIDKTVIFLDDMERVIDTIDIHKLFGAINGLVEQRKYKVVVIANNSYIQEKEANRIIFEEKVVEKTIVYEPDLVAIYKEICDKASDASFSSIMKEGKAISVIDPSFPSYKEHDELQTNLRNIRILKFALSHFYKIYDEYNNLLVGEDKDIVKSFLFALWASTVGLSIEYKKNRLTYKDREQYLGYAELSSNDWQFYDGTEEKEGLFEGAEIEEAKDEHKRESAKHQASNRVKYVFQKIVKPHELPIIVSEIVFDFITAGISLDKKGLQELWNKYKIQELQKKQSPAYTLLNRFMRSQWSMSNKEMEDALIQLAQYVEDGAFQDNLSYVNAATFLQHMIALTPYSKEEMKGIIKKGIDKLYSKISTISLIDTLNLNVSETQIPQVSQWVVAYEKEKMDKVKTFCMEKDIKEVCRQFNEDLPALANRLTIQYGNTKTPDFINYPILSHISQSDIEKKVNEIQPNEVMALYHILNDRFNKNVAYPSVYDAELVFVGQLEQALAQRKQVKKVYADILIEDYLMKVIKKIQK